MITEDIADVIKAGAAFGVPTTTVVFGLPLQEWMYLVSIFAGLLLVFERLPYVYTSVMKWKDKMYEWFAK